MNSSWVEESHEDAIELDAEEVSRQISAQFHNFISIFPKTYLLSDKQWITSESSHKIFLLIIQELFNQLNVILTRVPASHINEINVAGVIFIFRKQDSYFLEWKPNENVEMSGAEIAEDAIDEWSIINQITFKPTEDNISFIAPKVKNLRIPLCDIKQFKVQGPELQLVNRSDQHIITYNFKRSNAMSIVRFLQNMHLLKQSLHDRNVFIVKDPQYDRLQRSFAELNIEEIKSSRTPNRPFFMPGYDFLSSIGNNVLGRPARQHRKLEMRPGALRYDASSGAVQPSTSSSETSPETFNKLNNDNKIKIDEVLKSHLPPRKICTRDNPLTARQWNEFMTEDGRVSDPDRIREIIFHGGIEPSLRAEVWKYLLNYDIWEHTSNERAERRQQLSDEYERMKLQWTTLSKTQEKNHSGENNKLVRVMKIEKSKM